MLDAISFFAALIMESSLGLILSWVSPHLYLVLRTLKGNVGSSSAGEARVVLSRVISTIFRFLNYNVLFLASFLSTGTRC